MDTAKVGSILFTKELAKVGHADAIHHSVNTVYVTAKAVSSLIGTIYLAILVKFPSFDTAIVARLESRKELIQYDKSSWHLFSRATRARRGEVRVQAVVEAGAGAGAGAAAIAVLRERRRHRLPRLPSRRKASRAANRSHLLLAR